MAHSNRDPLLTRVRNTSGGERAFGYLGRHGMRLADDEVFLLHGNLIDILANDPSDRKFQSLERDLAAGKLAIEQTPPPLLYDPILHRSRALTLVNNTLGIIAPEWELSDFSDIDIENTQ